MIKITLPAALLLCLSFSAQAVDGMINVSSNHDVNTTADRLEKVLTSKGMTVFNRVRHSDGAQKVGVELRDTQLIIFGNPKVGSPLMKCAQTVAIDLPQKALIWQDDSQRTWISYNDPTYLKSRHDIQGCDKVLQKVSGALSKLTGAAAK